MKRAHPNTREGFGVLNPWGDVWTAQIFETEQEAKSHLEGFWKEYDCKRIEDFRIVRCRLRVSVLPASNGEAG